MIAPLFFGIAIVACALFELLFPGRPIYHAGWFNVVIAAAIVLMAIGIGKSMRKIESTPARIALTVAAFAAAVAGFTAIASGLLGPNDQTVVAAPGQTVRVDELGGALVFPLAMNGAASDRVQLRSGNDTIPIGSSHVQGSFLLQSIPRTVVAVDASDPHGAHLTVTQPTGAAFLSPVLLMQGHQSIDGFDVPYDAFAVPAAHRSVKAVLFSNAQAARLPGLDGTQAAVLFDVESANGRELRGGIGVARSGQRVVLAGLALRPAIFDYPAIRIVSVPNLPVTVAAALVAALAAAAAAAAVARATRSAAPAG